MAFTIKVDVDLVGELANDLSSTAGSIQAGLARGVNVAAKIVRQDSVDKVVAQVNLKKPYVDPKVTISAEATDARPTATISAPIRGTLLDRFDGRQQVYANVWTAAKYAAAFGSIAAPAPLPPGRNGKRRWAPWIPRTGDATRGIPAGKKQAGIAATIKAGGSSSHFAHVFFMPAVRPGQDGSKFVTMSRPKGGGKAKAKYGPSIDQVVKRNWFFDEDEITGKLEESIMSEVTTEITKGLAK